MGPLAENEVYQAKVRRKNITKNLLIRLGVVRFSLAEVFFSGNQAPQIYCIRGRIFLVGRSF